MIFGPELALRGNDEVAMREAIQGMHDIRKLVLSFFWLGLLFMACSATALGFLKFPNRSAIIVASVIVLGTAVVVRGGG